MRLMLRVVEGPAAGTRFLLMDGQAARVGRTEWADFPVRDPSLAEVHFSIKTGVTGDHLQAMSGAELTVNGQPTAETALRDGDRIAAGASVFEVRLTGEVLRPAATRGDLAESAASPPKNKDAATPVAPQVAEIAARASLSPAAQAGLQADHTPDQFIEALLAAELYADAVRFRAAELAPPEAVCWAGDCVRQALGDSPRTEDAAALDAARRWAEDPTEEYRRAAETAAIALDRQGPAAFVALAAFWSGDNIAPAGLPPAPTPPGLALKGIAGALLLAAPLVNTQNIAESIRQFLTAKPRGAAS